MDKKYQLLQATWVQVSLALLPLLVISSYLTYTIYAEQPKQIPNIATQQTETQGFPVRLKIPRINVDAPIENVGVTPQGEMEVPNNTANVGWFDLGPRPGETGSAVIAGHFDDKNGKAGVFAHLDKLREGDTLYIEYEKGITITFVVHALRMYEPGYAEEVFSRSDTAHLNLITCYGAWNDTKKSYSKRLIVFADITN